MKKSLFISTVVMVFFLTGCFGGISLPRLDPELFINDVLMEGPTQTLISGQELVVKGTLRIASQSEGFASPVRIDTIQDYDLFGGVSFAPIGDPNYTPPECGIYLYWDEIISSVPNIECRNPNNYVLPLGIDQIEPPMGNNRSPSLSAAS